MTPFLAIPSSTGHEAGLVPADSLAQRQALRLGWLFLLSNTCVLVLSSLPVLAELPDFYRTWFGLTDVIRILEPIVALPFQILILAETGIFQYDTDARLRKNSMALIIFFSVSAALYQQGAGLHSGSAMHKDVLETLKDDAGAVENYPILQQMYEYIRDTWQHLVSHYIYASGGILLAGVSRQPHSSYTQFFFAV